MPGRGAFGPPPKSILDKSPNPFDAMRFLSFVVLFVLAAISSRLGFGQTPDSKSRSLGVPDSLREATFGRFEIGVGISDSIGNQPENWALLKKHFSIVTPENCMKPQSLERTQGKRNFETADKFVEFASSNNLRIVGHCLIWAKDDRTHEWYFKDGEAVEHY